MHFRPAPRTSWALPGLAAGLAASLWLAPATTAAQAPLAPSAATVDAPAVHAWRENSTPAELALDAAAFQGLDATLARSFTDVQSAVIVLRGRVVYSFYRDGDPQALRDTQSASKSALSVLVGTALAQGRIASVDQRVLELMPEWAGVQSDPRAAQITLRHLLTLTAGFAINDPTGTGAALAPRDAWARPLAADPGQTFAYDNSVVPLLVAILQKATGMRLADYAREQLVAPLGLAEPSYGRGVHLRTLDMAKIGQLYLQRGQWDGRQLVPRAFADASVAAQNAGGPPARLSYGYLWWVVPRPTPTPTSAPEPSPAAAPRPTFLASGFGGQFIWVHPALDLVVATTAPATVASNQRGHALQWLRTEAFAAARQRAQAEPR